MILRYSSEFKYVQSVLSCRSGTICPNTTNAMSDIQDAQSGKVLGIADAKKCIQNPRGLWWSLGYNSEFVRIGAAKQAAVFLRESVKLCTNTTSCVASMTPCYMQRSIGEAFVGRERLLVEKCI